MPPESTLPLTDTAMPPFPTLSLTLIAATTPSFGLGLRNALPWPALKGEMAYFARVTKRVASASQHNRKNAVIMGRKTWESIPDRFRPLKGRWNVVLTSSSPQTLEGEGEGREGTELIVVKGGLGEAVERLRGLQEEEEGKLGKVFVIGGAEVYKCALEMREARRILLTRIKRDFECDVFFPLKEVKGQDGGWELETCEGEGKGVRWRRCSKEQLDEWTEEEVPAGVQREKDVEWEFEMWERVD